MILRDGTILGANGYDPRSQLLVSVPAGLKLTVPDRPTPADVAAAVAALDDVIQNFPFERPEHRAAWFAGLLTPLAWFAFDGPAPLLLIDGNTRGCGKGLLADVIALVLTGRRFPVMSYTLDKEELRKKITSLAMEGERLVLLDNLAGAVGNDVLDMALTADRWKDPVLGVNKVFDGPLHVAWYATGNNVQLHADTSRRCSHCRIETPHERPELRDDVKYTDLRAHVREHRGPLLSAALTILRGWFAAGRPCHSLAPWGSFEGWSGVVREAVVFAGLPDPGETRLALQTTADRDALTMSAMIDAMERMDPDRNGLTTAGIVDAVRKPGDRPPEWFEDLKSAVEELCGKLDGPVLGYRFRRNFGGKMIDRAPNVSSNNSVRWVVKSVGTAVQERDGVKFVTAEVVVTPNNAGNDPPSRFHATTKVSATGLDAVRMEQAVYDPPVPLLRGPRAGKAEWTDEGAPNLRRPRTTYVATEPGTVDVPAGRFQAVKVVQTGDPQDGTKTWWYAPGVGLLKREHGVGEAAQVAITLKSFTPGKK